jgi:hypothetical protein
MPILNDALSLWEIAFRWAGYDPDRPRLRIPLAVRDNFRTLMDAILEGHLYCSTLGLEKSSPIYVDEPQAGIRFWLDDVYAVIQGIAFDRKLLRWAQIDRWAFEQWCERRTIPLPEFWFPTGWSEYRWPGESEPDEAASSEAGTGPEPAAPQTSQAADPPPGPFAAEKTSSAERQDEGASKRRLDHRQRSRIACQEVARRYWKKHPDASIKTVATSPEVWDIAPGSEFEQEVVERWLSEVDRRDPARKRGPKKKR